jgi:hypothetical protein
MAVCAAFWLSVAPAGCADWEKVFRDAYEDYPFSFPSDTAFSKTEKHSWMSAGIVLDVSSGLQGLTAAAFATQVRRLVSFAFFSGYELGSWVGV